MTWPKGGFDLPVDHTCLSAGAGGTRHRRVGGYQFHIGLTPEKVTTAQRPPGYTGLSHSTFLYALTWVLQQVVAAGIPLDGASDHNASEAINLRDQD